MTHCEAGVGGGVKRREPRARVHRLALASSSSTTMTASVANQEIPKSNGITDGIDGYHRRVLITGLRRSGKTSCKRVVFNGTAPKDTFFVQTTQELEKTRFK
ncbi:hypothetical protein FRC15_003645 [Serendipita sp. 397]|nr:hypothetical protein FRC15_003645 [Serendipita sp. 397]